LSWSYRSINHCCM